MSADIRVHSSIFKRLLPEGRTVAEKLDIVDTKLIQIVQTKNCPDRNATRAHFVRYSRRDHEEKLWDPHGLSAKGLCWKRICRPTDAVDRIHADLSTLVRLGGLKAAAEG